MKSTPQTAAWTLLAATVIVASLWLPQRAQAQAKWAITNFTGRGVDAGTLGTFHDLLRDQIQQEKSVTFTDVAAACGDAGCARQAALSSGAETVVFGSVDALGKKLIVSVRSVELATGNVTFSQSMSIARVEELDTAAKRMAKALAHGDKVEDNVELGTVTKEEAKVPQRRGTRFALLLGMQGVLPQAGFADLGGGAGFGMGVFIETTDFVIEPTLSYRFDLSSGKDSFNHVPLEVAMGYLFSQSDVAPLLGGGVGLGFIDETVHVKRSVGAVLVSTSKDEINDTLFGFTVFPRVGVLFLRTYGVSVELAADYLLTFADFQERSLEHGFRFELNLVLGGG